jgi:hypothetical protein
MLHLTTERLAALADEQPNEIEAAHLAACPQCGREREAQRRLYRMARLEASRPVAPLTTWEGIEAALAAGDATPGAGSGHDLPAAEPRRLTFGRRLPAVARRLAAASALLAAGLAAGRASAGAPVFALGAAADTAGRLASLPTEAVLDSIPSFRSTDDALAALTSAEHQYQLAANFLAAHDTIAQPVEDSSALFRTRLAALDEVMAATRAALYEAPHDPVINRYYLATLGAREVTVRQLGTSLPPGQSVSRF